MLAGDFARVRLSGAANDAGFILDAAHAAGPDVGLLERVRDHLDRAVAAGHGDLDTAATYLAHRADRTPRSPGGSSSSAP